MCAEHLLLVNAQMSNNQIKFDFYRLKRVRLAVYSSVNSVPNIYNTVHDLFIFLHKQPILKQKTDQLVIFSESSDLS